MRVRWTGPSVALLPAGARGTRPSRTSCPAAWRSVEALLTKVCVCGGPADKGVCVCVCVEALRTKVWGVCVCVEALLLVFVRTGMQLNPDRLEESVEY